MGALEEWIAEMFLVHSLNLLRFSADVQGKIVALMGAMSKELAAKLGEGEVSTYGKQRMAALLRESNAVIASHYSGMEAEAMRNLLGVTQQTQQAIATIKAHEDALKAATKAKEEAAAAAGRLTGALGLLAAGLAALKIVDYIKDSALLAARYETLGVVMEVVGRNAGYTKTQMMTATDAIARQGITMVESRESAVKLVQAHVDLKNATVLARIAQDAAVIGHLNSSDAFDRLVNGISRGNVLILRNIGINVNLQSAYRQMADELGKTTKELTENERVQARLNAVIERGADIAGTYEAAMGTAGKQLTSMQRYVQDLKTNIGETFNEVLTVSVMAFTSQLKDANGEVSELSRNGQLAEWGHALAQVFVVVADNVNNAFSAMKLLAAGASYLGTSIDITKQYAKDIASAGFSVDGQVAAYEKQRAAVEANKQALAKEKDDILAGEDKFQKAFDERTATVSAKRKSDAEAKLKIDADYAQKSLAVQKAYAGYSLEIQQKAQLALANSIYVGTPDYRDTKGREPKPKVDQAENIHLSAQLKQFEREAADTKAHYDALGKLDDLYLKAGELSAGQAYENKRAYAAASYEAEVDAYQQELVALKNHKSATKAEEERHQKEIEAILGKLDAAEKGFFANQKYRDEEERLRKASVVAGSNDVINKYISSLNQEAQKIEDSNHIHEKVRSVIEREEVARLDLAIAYQKQFMEGQAAAGATAEEIAQGPAILKFLEDQRAARLRLAQGMEQQDQMKLAQIQVEANKKMWESVDQVAHDTFVSIFDSGKSAFDRLRDTLKNGLLDLLYQMTIKKWILNIGASVTGAGATSLAMAGDLGAAGGTVGGGLGGVANLAQSAKTAYTIATQGFSGVAAGIGGSIATLGNLFGSSAVSAFGAGMGMTGAQAATASAAYGSAGMASTGTALTSGAVAGAAVTAAAGIAAGVLGGKLISGQFGSNATVIGGTGIGAIAGAFMGGPIGAAIGGALGGVIGGIGNRVFGMGDKKYGETGITGTLSGSGFSGNEYAKWTQKGGWLRSDKSGTDTSAVDATTSAAFVETYAAIRNVSATLANTLGVDTAKTALDKSKSWVATLNGLNASTALGAQSTLTPEQKYAEARAQFEKTLAAANAGDTTAQSGLSAAEQAFLAASQVVNASDARYVADYARVMAANDEALKWAGLQVDVQQASLDALTAQVSGLITINDSVLTVAQAIANLQAAMGTATGLGVRFDGSHAGGLASVPFDGYAAELHRGEVVVDAPAAAAMRRYFGGVPSQGGGNTDALVAEIKSLREEVKGLRADQDKQTGAAIRATVESNDKAANRVVAGIDKSTKASAWTKQPEYEK